MIDADVYYPQAGEKESCMCLAVPMKVKEINGFNCLCEARGIEREVSLFMLQDETLEPGDHILVHVGYAIQKVSEEEAADTWELFDEILATEA
jgi:hydrogenase expression/formation protein HypC